MRPDVKSGDGATLRGLSNDLRDASDSVVLRVTHVIDTLPERGATDRLLDGLRPRLGELRPPRPPGLARVLFMPLHPVIVSTGEWRTGQPTLPRSLIAPVTALVRARLPDPAAIEASLALGIDPDGQLWQDAAAILADGPLPVEWSLPAFQAGIGIQPQAMPPLLDVIRLVFAHAHLIPRPGSMRPSGPVGEPAWDALRPFLLKAARSGRQGWGIVLALLFEQTTAPAALVENVLALTRETGIASQLQAGLQSAVGSVVDKLDQEAPEPSPSDESLNAQAERASRMAGFSALRGDMQAFARKLARRRRQLATQCTAQLVDGLSGAAQACVPTGALAPQAEQEAAERLETRLRSLRRLDLAARPLGDAAGRDQLLGEAAAFYTGTSAPAWLTRADRLRLCEILVGAEAALRLFGP